MKACVYVINNLGSDFERNANVVLQEVTHVELYEVSISDAPSECVTWHQVSTVLFFKARTL